MFKEDENTLNKGIWDLIEKNKISSCDLTKENMQYKVFDSIAQPIKSLANIDLFYIKYKLLEGCSNCQKNEIKDLYYQSFVDINLDNILQHTNFEFIIRNIFENKKSGCELCGYDKNNKIISQSKYHIIIEIKYP